MFDELLTFDEDGRTVPSKGDSRQGAFKGGWTEGVKHERGDHEDTCYQEKPKLSTLYWHNLGFRVGYILGQYPDEERDSIYRFFESMMIEAAK
jgi:hypothetical protein